MSLASQPNCGDVEYSSVESTIKNLFRNKIFQALLYSAIVGGALTLSHEAQAKNPISFEGEIGLSIGLPPTPVCNPYSYRRGGDLRVSRDGEAPDCLHEHPRFNLALSYIWAPQIGEEEGDGDGLHPNHRFKTLVGLNMAEFANLGLKLELAGGRGTGFQAGGGGVLDLHLGGYHNVAISALGRKGSFEFLAEYRAAIAGKVALGVTSVVEGHAGETHWGVGPIIGYQGRHVGASLDMAFGNFNHIHFALVFAFGGAEAHPMH